MSDTANAALYARISTKNQDLQAQKDKLWEWDDKNDKYDCDMYSEQISGKDDDREQFQTMKENAEKYDVIVVTKIDRFGRSTRHILQNIDWFDDKDTKFLTLDQPIDTREDGNEMSQLMGRVMTLVLSVFAEFERRMIRQRMEEGFRQAQEEGRVGRPKKLTDKQIERAQNKYDRGWSKKQVHGWLLGEYDDLDVSYDTVRRHIGDQDDE